MAGGLFGKGREQPPEDDEINIVSMIDVVMLLLIFFMISSNMSKSTEMKIPPADHGIEVPTDKSIVISIFKTDSDPQIYLSDGKENGPADLAAVKEYVQEQVRENRNVLILKADRDVPSGVVEEVARAASEVDPDLKYYMGVVDRLK
ncbi:ExbD/TolR family protein [Planctomicrobium sp. SH664]|uniref:ExbD/TolR family protein n=1 Tax=Planctomicrobium sp. SH664 TaxID=3448125 RepID=UPI003F5BA137